MSEKKSKLGIAYNLFDGEELLEKSILSIRNVVDYVCIVWQRVSNKGNFADPYLEVFLNKLKEKGLIDELIEYVPRKFTDIEKINMTHPESTYPMVATPFAIFDRACNELTKVIDIQEDSNEVVEWLGDGIIQSVVACYLRRRYPDQDEGFLTKLRSKLVKTEALATMAKFLGFGEFIIMSEHVEKACNGRNNSRILEDAFEAFVGVLAEDFGIDEQSRGYLLCTKFVISCIESSIDITELIMKDDNYKDQLMRYFQRMFNGQLPKYCEEKKEESEQPTTGGRIFYMYVLDTEGKKIGSGYAKSKKEAEQRAAKYALYQYGIRNGY